MHDKRIHNSCVWSGCLSGVPYNSQTTVLVSQVFNRYRWLLIPIWGWRTLYVTPLSSLYDRFLDINVLPMQYHISTDVTLPHKRVRRGFGLCKEGNVDGLLASRFIRDLYLSITLLLSAIIITVYCGL